MEVQKVFSYIMLICGIVYFIIFSIQIIKEKKKGNLKLTKELPFVEGLVYFLAALGISDFLMNTIFIKKTKFVDDRNIPHSLIATTIVPSSMLAFLFLKKSESIDLRMLVIYMSCLIIGAIIGSSISRKIETTKIKHIMVTLLRISIIAIIIKIALTFKNEAYISELTGWRLVILIVVSFFMGIFNMFGIPMKPIAASLFILLGMSPIVTLTMMQILGSINPLVGGVYVVKDNRYSKGMVLCSMTIGCICSFLAVTLAISLNQFVLSSILVVVILIAIQSLKDSK